MTKRFRLTALALGLLGGAVLAPQAGGAAESYLVKGLPFFPPYRVAIASLDVSGGTVSGSLTAPAGDPRPAVPLSGTLKEGRLSLTIGTGKEAVTLAFIEGEREPHQLWEEAAPIADLPEVVLFRPQAGFSRAALAVQHADTNWCGRFLGGLSVELRAATLKASPEAPAALADLDVVLAANAEDETRKLAAVWPRLRLAALSGDDVMVDVTVPVGEEVKRAQELRAVPEVAAVELPSGCGEMALVAVPRDQIMDGDAVSEAKLKAFADATLARFLSGAQAEAAAPGARKFKLEGAKVTRGPDGLLHYEARLTGDAEATRLGAGEVDAFTLTLTPLETVADTAETISLIPQVGDLRTARRAGSGAPADGAFKAVQEEAVPVSIAHRFVSWLAAREGTGCAFLTQTAFDEPEGALACANRTLDSLGDEGGGD